jgi:hypothetical protein
LCSSNVLGDETIFKYLSPSATAYPIIYSRDGYPWKKEANVKEGGKDH